MLIIEQLPNSSSQILQKMQFQQLHSPQNSSHLLVSSWDKHVYLYDAPAGRLIRQYEHRAPVLDIAFGADDSEAFSGGLDWGVRR